MPRLNEIKLLEKIKEEYGNRDYVGIFCTASGTVYLLKKEQSRGLFFFVAEKPFDGENHLIKPIIGPQLLLRSTSKTYNWASTNVENINQ